MITNESTTDRIVRLVAGAAAVIAAIVAGPGTVLGIVLLVLAAVLVVTAAIGFCPLYRVFGMSTCKVPAPRP